MSFQMCLKAKKKHASYGKEAKQAKRTKKGLDRICRGAIRKAKVQLELKLDKRDIRNKGFLRHMSNQQKHWGDVESTVTQGRETIH